ERRKVLDRPRRKHADGNLRSAAVKRGALRPPALIHHPHQGPGGNTVSGNKVRAVHPHMSGTQPRYSARADHHLAWRRFSSHRYILNAFTRRDSLYRGEAEHAMMTGC